MILGIGNDLTNVERFKKFTNNEQFINRILTENEKLLFNNLKEEKKANFLAKRFAGKEAFSKALGCGIGGSFKEENKFTFHSIEILKTEKLAPFIELKQEALKTFIKSSFISFSDEKELIMVTVVIEG